MRRKLLACNLLAMVGVVERAYMTISRKSAFTLFEVMVVSAIIGLLAALAIPNYVRARDTSRLNVAMDNLRLINDAKNLWAEETHQPVGTAVPDLGVLANYFRNGTVQNLIGETYVPNPIGVAPGVQLPKTSGLGEYPPGAFISLDADD